MNRFKIKIFILLSLFVIFPFRPVLADQSEYQKSLADYQQSQTTFTDLQTADEKINGAKKLLSRATQLAIDYQKLIKEEIASASELEADQKNSFSARLDNQISAQESSLTQMTALTDSNQIKDLSNAAKQRWQKDLYLISEINGTILSLRSKDIIDKIKDASQLLEQKIQDYPNEDNQKEATTFLDESKQNLVEAEKQCQESLNSFSLVKDDQANGETLTSDGQDKFQNCQISLKKSVKSLKAAGQVINTPNNTPRNSQINLDY